MRLMKQLITSLAVKMVPEGSALRNIAKRIYARLYTDNHVDVIHRLLSDDEQTRLREAVKIGFIGDLILLRDMVELGRGHDGKYDYSPMFSSIRDFFAGCDLMTGVLEGPLSGEELGYTTANYDDGRPLHCGYPDAFLNAIMDAGIGFVTVANNHLYDKGRKGMERTINVLEENSMPYVGYGKNSRTVITVKGLKIAVLAYNFALNGTKESFVFEKGNEDLPHPIFPKSSKYYKRCLEIVNRDFEWAKAQKPHSILVYPHVGEQFRHKPDDNQLHWFDIFRSQGADIILGCHPHATQPLKFEGNSVNLYCPGNFVNNYFPYDGDASAMVEIYLDQSSGKPFAAAIIPILAYGNRNELLRAEPMSKLADKAGLSQHDWLRLQDAHKTVTSSMLGISIPLEQAQNRYIIWNDNTYRRFPYEHKSALRDDERTHHAEKLFEKADTVVFIGDSITEGTKNGGYGWFEPLMASMPKKKVLRFAKGLTTVRGILDIYGQEIGETKAELFCIALGCNDIRYRNEATCAMTAEEYAEDMNKLLSIIKSGNPDAAIILVAPWWSDDVFDKCCAVDSKTKHQLYDAYSESLKRCGKCQPGGVFVDPNPWIWKIMRSSCRSRYLVDWIHPNAVDGIRLFSDAFVYEISKLR